MTSSLLRLGARRQHGTALDDVHELRQRTHDDVDLEVELPLELLHDALYELLAIREPLRKTTLPLASSVRTSLSPIDS